MSNTPEKSKQLYLRLLKEIKPYWKVLIISVISLISLSATEAAFATILEKMIDKIFVAKDPFYTYAIPIALICIALLRGIMSFTSTASISWVALKVIMNLRQNMFSQLLKLPVQYYKDNPNGKIIAKITFDSAQVRSAASNSLIILVRDSFAVIFLILLMIYYSWQLTLITFISFPAIAFAVTNVSKRMRQLNSEVQSSMGDLTAILEESLSGHKVIKIFNGYDYEIKRFNSVANWLRRYANKVKVASAVSVASVELIISIVLAAIIYIAANFSLSETNFTAGQFTAFFTAMGLMFPPIKRLTKINESVQRGLAASASIFDLIDTDTEQQSGKLLPQQVKGNIEFKNICFSYNNSEDAAISNLSFSINSGETVALVGQSGSGKTTLANLLPRFYELEQGTILIDEANIAELDLKSLRHNISSVSQDVILFNDTVAANIAYGSIKEEKDKEAIISAATAANAMEFIKKMPNGIDTLIGENGAKLSGGQRQRLAIARAILKDAPILILDEATSALDNESEYKVQAALENLQQGRTTLVIAHRLSTIENADRIIVLEKGSIVEQGTHKELLKRQGHYYKLHNTQFSS